MSPIFDLMRCPSLSDVARGTRVGGDCMGHSGRGLLVCCAVLLCAGPAVALEAMDTRLSFSFADDDVLRGPDKSPTGSPSIPNFSPSGNNRLFFDDYERRDNGFENLSYLVMYANKPGFFAGVDTEAGMVVRAQVTARTKEFSLTDDGSYVRFSKNFNGHRVGVTAFPVSADRFRLGYSYDISWGGARIFRNAQAVPGLRLEYESKGISAYLGAKTGFAQVDMQDGTKEMDTVWGILGGAALDLHDNWRIEAGGGLFDRGTIDKRELRIVENGKYNTPKWYGYGGTMQLTYHIGDPIGTPIDFRLYRNDPLAVQQFYAIPHYGPGLSLTAKSEISFVFQRLQDGDAASSTSTQMGIAGDITVILKWRKWRMQNYVVYRDLAFMLYNVPSYPSFVDFSSGSQVHADLLAFTNIDYYIESWHLLPGIILGLRRPASITGVADATSAQSLGAQTFVFRSEADPDVLDPGDKVKLIFSAKATLRWDLSSIVSLLGELQYSFDPNRRTFAQDENGISTRTASASSILGFMAMMRARF